MLISFQETLENILREKIIKLIFGKREHGNLKKIAFREQGNMAIYFFREHGTSWEGLFSGIALHASKQCLISY